jgi:alpha-glucosidase/alpha-D-xyloside xylohydrolase
VITGFHQCRWGYRNVTITKEVVDNFKKAQIPLDTMWNDIDYMDSYKCFTHDKERFPLDTWRPFVDQLHNDGQHYVLITDPGECVPFKTSPYIGFITTYVIFDSVWQ